jgi:hypothetical protein
LRIRITRLPVPSGLRPPSAASVAEIFRRIERPCEFFDFTPSS